MPQLPILSEIKSIHVFGNLKAILMEGFCRVFAGGSSVWDFKIERKGIRFRKWLILRRCLLSRCEVPTGEIEKDIS